MKPKMIHLVFCAFLAIVSASTHADVVVWNLTDVTFQDGGVAHGFVTLTDDGLTDWRISVSGGITSVFPALIYDPQAGAGSGAPMFIDLNAIDANGENRRLQLFPAGSINGGGGAAGRIETLDLLSVEQIISGPIVERRLKGPSLSSIVPEPSMLIYGIWGLGTLAMVFFARVRKHG